MTTVPGFDAPRAQEYLASWLVEIGEQEKPGQPVLDLLAGMFFHSPFLRDCAMKESSFMVEMFATGFDDTCQRLIHSQAQPDTDEGDLENLVRHLRVNKRRMALLTGVADLGGWWHDDKITMALS